MAETPNQSDQRGVAVLSPATAERFRDMLLTLPVGDGTQATEQIISALLAAVDVDSLNAPWEGGDIDPLLGRTIVIDSAQVWKSDYADGIGAFLRCEGVDAETGEVIGFTTGSLAIVAQVTAAHVNDLLPIRCIPIRAERKTQRGYQPERLEVLSTRATGRKAADK